MTSEDDGEWSAPSSGPPSLQYELRSRKLRITIFWGMVMMDSSIIPIVLYSALWKGSDLDHNTIYNIISATLGGTCVLEYVQRLWMLCKKSSTCRLSGAKWPYIDSFQWILTLALVVVIALVTLGGLPKEPKVRILALIAPSFVLTFALQLLLLDILRLLKFRAPVSISSVPRKGILRPAIYSIIEDVVAVDGGGGTVFRERLNKRYQASHHFRKMLHSLSLFWSISGLVIGLAMSIIIFKIDKNTAYVLGWCVPFVWAGTWALITIQIVKYEVEVEKENWDQDRLRILDQS